MRYAAFPFFVSASTAMAERTEKREGGRCHSTENTVEWRKITGNETIAAKMETKYWKVFQLVTLSIMEIILKHYLCPAVYLKSNVVGNTQEFPPLAKSFVIGFFSHISFQDFLCVKVKNVSSPTVLYAPCTS